VKDNKDEKYLKYNKSIDLPKNISEVHAKKDKSIIIGYQVSIHNKNISIHKSFQSSTEPLEESLRRAIEYKNNMLQTLSKND
jgi:hypothetical protein